MSQASEKPLTKRILVIISGLFFLGSSVSVVIGMLNSSPQSAQQPTPTEAQASVTEQLQAQAEGYEQVLAREPDNLFALQGLVEIRLQMQDFEGAIAPLEKLVEIYPDQPQYIALLEGVKQQVELSKQPNAAENQE